MPTARRRSLAVRARFGGAELLVVTGREGALTAVKELLVTGREGALKPALVVFVDRGGLG